MTSVLFTLGRCEAVSLDSVLSNGDIVCFAPSLDSAIDRSRLTTGGTTGETTGTTLTSGTREGDAGGAQPLTLTLTLALTRTRTRTRTLTLTLPLTLTLTPVSTAERSTSPSAAEVQPRAQSRASSPREIALEDGCEIERGASSEP